MSFLSSHRLHWGVHHELSDNFLVQLERIVHDAAGITPDATSDAHSVNSLSARDTDHAGSLIPPTTPQPEALGP
ncbi:MAG: hypothetical protein ABW223_05810 [Rariglobus sp.]